MSSRFRCEAFPEIEPRRRPNNTICRLRDRRRLSRAAQASFDRWFKTMEEASISVSYVERVKSIPQVFIDGLHIGGYDDLKLTLG